MKRHLKGGNGEGEKRQRKTERRREYGQKEILRGGEEGRKEGRQGGMDRGRGEEKKGGRQGGSEQND